MAIKKIIKIGFDLDGVIIDKPLLIPKKLIELLFRGYQNEKLHYRYPRFKLEILIRQLSHFYLFRPAIKKNIAIIKELAQEKNYELYLISSRYSFLAKQTKIWLGREGLNHVFKKIYLNLQNRQPHLFKEEVVKSIHLDIFLDDDNLIVDYLSGKIDKTKIYCFTPEAIESIKKLNC